MYKDFFDIHHFNTVTSTNDVAKQIARDGIEGPTIVRADEQTAGRGRRGNKWVSNKNSGLYFSLVFQPKCDIEKVSLYPLIVGTLIQQCLFNEYEITIKLKWPNDLYIDHKVGGVLVESVFKGTVLNNVILGVGININNIKNSNDIEQPFTWLSKHIHAGMNPNSILDLLLNCLYKEMSEFSALNDDYVEKKLAQWTNNCLHLEKDVRIAFNGETITGRFVGIDKNGCAQIQTKNEIKIVSNFDEFSLRW